MKYEIEFEWICKGEPPKVLISEIIVARDGNERLGGQVIEVFEEPIAKNDPDSRDWDDWEPGPLAKKILQMLNS